MITLFILWCLLRSAKIADEMLDIFERDRNSKKGGDEVCTL
jgi:hypothetical protein